MMSNVQIDYPNQTSQWGKMLIDILNTHLSKVQEQIQGINTNFDNKFKEFQRSLDQIKTTADTALTIAEENKLETFEKR